MPEDPALSIISCLPADSILICSAFEEYKHALEGSIKKSSNEGWVPLGKFGKQCKALFHYRVDLASNPFISHLCGLYEEVMKDTVILSMVENDIHLLLWRILLGKVLVIRPVDHALSKNVGFPRYIKDSHKMQDVKEIMQAPEEGLHLGLNQVLIMNGDLVIRFPKAGGGVYMMKAIYKK
ncbi:uncharacterized protein CIMG_08364 [Coccidioides immitis RS]|uniref:Uncharacterized protein n=1 Tax=Coccidioides immitis (strain RS) TaxID=246410 RepID=A0A0E1RVE0_COCIM|nr:uncharacterized protein CIMG_08364 [Coccidioides immitis RS]EAS29618.2 hypothetical protein CIMG_08364 [Coccidioides immitis RS]